MVANGRLKYSVTQRDSWGWLTYMYWVVLQTPALLLLMRRLTKCWIRSQEMAGEMEGAMPRPSVRAPCKSTASFTVLLGLWLHRPPYKSWIIKVWLVVNSKGARPALTFTSAPPQSPFPWQHTGVHAYQGHPCLRNSFCSWSPAFQLSPTMPASPLAFSVPVMPTHFSQVGKPQTKKLF